MTKRSTRLRRWLAVIPAALIAAGCSALPTAPVLDSTAPAGGLTSPADETSRQIAPDDPGGTGEPVITAATKKIGTKGGTLSAGRFTLVVPANAMKKNGVITLSQPDSYSPVARLTVTPASASALRAPLILVVNASPLSSSGLTAAYFKCLNPVNKKWEKVVGSSANPSARTVQAHVLQFSTYRLEIGGVLAW